MGCDSLTTKILGIINPKDFYYYACSGCQKRIYSDRLHGFTCYRCKANSAAPSCKYRLKFTIVHASSVASVTVFDKPLEKYFGCKAADLVRFLDHPHENVGNTARVKSMLISAISKVFIGQFFLFQFSEQSTTSLNTPNSGLSQKRKSFLAKEMSIKNQDGLCATVIYCLFSELQGVVNSNDVMTKIIKNSEIMKRMVRKVNEEMSKKIPSEWQPQLDSQSIKVCKNSPNNSLADENNFCPVPGSSVLMDDVFVKNFFEGSFSFFHKQNDGDLDLTRIIKSNGVSKLWKTGGEDSALLAITPGPLNRHEDDDASDLAAEECYGASFSNKKPSKRYNGLLNSYLTSTPTPGQSLKRRRISIGPLFLLDSHHKDRSVSDIFADDSATSQGATTSMDLFDSIN